MAGGIDSCSSASAFAIQNDGKVILACIFFNASDGSYAQTIRLNSDGSLDPTFNIDPKSSVFSQVWVMAKQADGQIILGGSFSVKAGQPRFSLARLLADSNLDASFTTSTNVAGQVKALVQQADGEILVGGWFSIPYATCYKVELSLLWK